jgi:hypothetical protein
MGKPQVKVSRRKRPYVTRWGPRPEGIEIQFLVSEPELQETKIFAVPEWGLNWISLKQKQFKREGNKILQEHCKDLREEINFFLQMMGWYDPT